MTSAPTSKSIRQSIANQALQLRFHSVRYLRMLTNAIVGGLLVAIYLVVLVLQLNPHVPVVSPTAGRWFVALLAMYGPYMSVVLYFLILMREAVASRPLSPAWLSVRLLAWLGAAGAAAAAVLTWANLRGFRTVLTEGAAERMRQGAVATTIIAAVLLAIALLRYSFGRRGSRATATLLFVSLLLSVVIPLWLRGPGELPVPAVARRNQPQKVGLQPPHVRMLLIDGASLGFIRERIAAGQLPNFGKLIDRGAAIDLATLKPTEAETVLVAAATGKYPPKNGIRSDARYRVQEDETDPVNLLPDYCFAPVLVYQGFVKSEELTSSALRARPIWDILADYGVGSGIVNWPLTRPARASQGYVVSDFFDEAASSPLRLADSQAADPTTAIDIARLAFDAWQVRTWQEVIPAIGPGEPTPAEIRWAQWDRAYSDAAAELEAQFGAIPRLVATRYEGIDHFGQAYLRDAEPERFGNVQRGDPRRSVLDRYYGYLDTEVGRTIAQLGPGDLLLVVSGFGMEPNGFIKRILGRITGGDDAYGTHEPAPDGFLLAFGTNVATGEYRRGSIVDLAPTILYYMGLPVGRDMDGFARTDLFRGNYTRDRPVTYTLTHER